MAIIFKETATGLRGLYNDPDKTSPIYVCDIGDHKTPRSHCFGPATRPYFLIHLIESGKGTVDRNGVITELTEGDAFIIRPGEVTTYKADDKHPWTYAWISFYGNFAESVMQQTSTKDYAKYKKEGLWALKTALDGKSLDNIYSLNILFAVLNSIKEDTLEAENDFVKTAVSYIENNFFRDFNASDLANILGVSRSHFSVTFTKHTGETPYNYLLKTRLAHAKDYLKNTSMSVTEIAYSVGFSGVERFSETFKQTVGLSPLAYRRSSR